MLGARFTSGGSMRAPTGKPSRISAERSANARRWTVPCGRCPYATTDARRSATEACSASGEVYELTRDRWLVPSALGAPQRTIDAGAVCQARQRLSRSSGDASRVSGFWHSSLASLAAIYPQPAAFIGFGG